MYEFWYYYVKPKYGEKRKSCYMNKGTFKDIYADFENDVVTRFDTSN